MRLTIRTLLTTIGLFIMTSANAELQIATITEGSGQAAEAGNKVFVHYTGKLEDGSVFDSSVTRGQPFSFTLGAGRHHPPHLWGRLDPMAEGPVPRGGDPDDHPCRDQPGAWPHS